MLRILSRVAHVFAFLLVMALPGALTAQAPLIGPWANQVSQQLRLATLSLDLGYSLAPSHDPVVDTLSNNTYKDFTYHLQGGATYLFVGVCDSDCSDLDLTLYDAHGYLIDRDAKPDKTAVVTVRVFESSDFRLRVTMAKCNLSPCWMGVGAFTPAN